MKPSIPDLQNSRSDAVGLNKETDIGSNPISIINGTVMQNGRGKRGRVVS